MGQTWCLLSSPYLTSTPPVSLSRLLPSIGLWSRLHSAEAETGCGRRHRVWLVNALEGPEVAAAVAAAAMSQLRGDGALPLAGCHVAPVAQADVVALDPVQGDARVGGW